MKFRTRLYTGFGFVIFIMAFILVIVVSLLHNQNNEMNMIIQDRYEKIKLSNQIRQNTGAIGREINKIALLPSRQVDQTTVQSIEREYQSLQNSILKLQDMLINTEAREFLTKVGQESFDYNVIVNEIIRKNYQAANSMNLVDLQQAEEIRVDLISNIDSLIRIQEQVMETTLVESKETYANAVRYVGIATAIGILIGILMAVLIVRAIINRLNRVKNVMKDIDYQAEEFPRIAVVYQDEIGEIATAYNEMASTLEVSHKLEREYMDDIEGQNWLKTKIAEISTMSQGLLDLHELGNQYISRITKIIGGQYGILYVKESTSNDVFLTRQASYAYDKSEYGVGREHIRVGEGLVGQSALDNETIILDNIPKDYIKISSGLGDTYPKAVIIVPVSFEGEVLAVLELASTTEFSPLYKLLIDQAANQLGVTLNRIEKHLQVQELLEEAQTLNEELQTQSEELQTQQEELRTMNDELEAQYRSSEQKTNELEEYKKELEEKNREVLLGSQYKSEFLANMSHELRTPLNSLIILSQMLYENKMGNLSDKQVEYAATIYTSGNDLLRLINDILDLSKIESGKMEIVEGEVVLSDVLSLAERQFSPIAKSKNISFSLNQESNLPTVLYTDEHRFYQILKNLLSNAFKFTDKGAVRLEVDKSLVALPDKGEAEYFTFSVIDTGTGIPKDKQSLIFEAFSQADGTTSRKHGGTGLGLSISKELAELLGGFISLDSNEGQGSTFTLYIPMNQEIDFRPKEEAAATVDNNATALNIGGGRSSDETKPATTDQLEGSKVLVVDDDMRNIFALTSALENAGMDVMFAENGKEALELIEENADVDLILMDIMMPEMDGYEAMREIRKIEEYTKVPIIALTAKAMKHDRQKCIDAGASDYISKPVNLEQLFSILKVWLHK